MATILAVRDVEIAYANAAPVLRGVSLEVPANAIVALLGANGAGKTSLLRAVTGLLGPHRGRLVAGSISLAGERIDGLDPSAIVRRGVSQVMEGRIFPGLTVAENLRVGAHLRRDRAAVRAARDRVLTLFPVLAQRDGVPAGYLSGGEQQMLAIGRALMQSPRLLLLDEPSLGIAPLVMRQIRDVLVEINRLGTAVLLVEQNAVLALGMADAGYVLHQGSVVKHGPRAELLDDPDIRAYYLGLDGPAGAGPEPVQPSDGSAAWTRC